MRGRKRLQCQGETAKGKRCVKHQAIDAEDGKGGWLVRDGIVLCNQHRDQGVWVPSSRGRAITVTVNGATVRIEV